MSRFISIREILGHPNWVPKPATRAEAEDGQAKVDIIPDRIHGDDIKEEAQGAPVPIEDIPAEKPSVVETPVDEKPLDEQAPAEEPIEEPTVEATVVEEEAPVEEKKAPAKKAASKAKKAE